MTIYDLPLLDYNETSFSLPITAGTVSLFLRFSWPVEIQQQYDAQLQILNTQFQSMPFFSLYDPENHTHIPFTFELISYYAHFLKAWEDHDDLTDILQKGIWPWELREAVTALQLNPDDAALYNGIKLLLMDLQPTLDYVFTLEEDLVWTVTTTVGTETRVACIQANCWQFQGHFDWRLWFQNDSGKIGRFDLGQTTLYVAIGPGDL